MGAVMSDDFDDSDATPQRGKRSRRKKQLSPYYQANDEGGFGNPPITKQFRKNNPGGPGRPKGQTTLNSAMRKVLRRKIPVTRNGRSTNLPATEVYAERLLEAILGKSSSPTMYEFGRRILAQYGPQEEPEESKLRVDYSGFSSDETKIFACLLDRALGLPAQPATVDVLRISRDPVPVGEFRIYRGPNQHMVIERINLIDACDSEKGD